MADLDKALEILRTEVPFECRAALATVEAELARLREECDRDHMPPATAARLRAERDEAVDALWDIVVATNHVNADSFAIAAAAIARDALARLTPKEPTDG